MNSMKEKLQPWNLDKESYEQRYKRPSPTAPNEVEIRFYDKYAKLVSKKFKNKNVFVLGATPEVMDIVLENNFITYCFDLSEQTIGSCNNLMKHKNNPNNHLKQGNWLEMDFKEGFFSIVLGDAPFVNLTTKEHNEELFEILKKQIMPNGYLVMRHLVLPELKPILKKELVSLYREGKMTFPDFLMELRIIVYQDEAYDKETYRYDAVKNFELIEEDYKKGIFNKDERNKLMKFRNNIINTFIPEKIFLKMAEKHGFKLIEIFQDKEFRFQNYLRMYVFQKK